MQNVVALQRAMQLTCQVVQDACLSGEGCIVISFAAHRVYARAHLYFPINMPFTIESCEEEIQIVWKEGCPFELRLYKAWDATESFCLQDGAVANELYYTPDEMMYILQTVRNACATDLPFVEALQQAETWVLAQK